MPPDNAFNLNGWFEIYNDEAEPAQGDRWSGYYNLTYADGRPIDDIVSVTFQHAASSGCETRINNTDNLTHDGAKIPAYAGGANSCVPNTQTCMFTEAATRLDNIHLSNDSSPSRSNRLAGVRVTRTDGKTFLLSTITEVGYDEFVHVVSRDPVARTMVVDGGSWLGSDGTNTGDVADQETIVTGPSKSGTAKTDGVPASTTFRIKDSNGQWIDNTNSNSGADHSGGSAQNFYVKNASGRVALARLDP